MSWEKFDSDIRAFIDYLKKYNFDKDSVILGLKRGGLPMAVALSNKMDIPISLVAFQTRDGNDSVPNFLEPELIRAAKKIIISDDIYDSGLTVETIIEALEKDFGISLDNIGGVFHYGSKNMTDTSLKYYRVLDSNEDKWVCFPFE